MATGTIQTYDFTTGLMLDFEPLIQQLDPYDTPLQSGLGADGRSALTMATATQVRVDWQDETGLTPRSTLAATMVTADTFMVVASGERERFQTDDVVIIDQEHFRITGYGTTTDSLTVSTRPFITGQTAVQHVNASAVVGVGSAPVEGADPPEARSRDRNARFNYCQIFGPYQIKVSGTENAVRKYGLTGTEFDKQVANRIRELSVAIEQQILYGARSIDTTNERRTAGGMNFYITTNVNTATTDVSEGTILDQMENVFNAGGTVDRLLVGAKQKRKMSAFVTGTIQVQQGDRTRGRVVDFYDSDFGRLSLLLHRWVRTNDAFGYSRDQVQLATLRPLFYEPLAKTGDSMKGQVLAEKTLRFGREKHAFKFTGLQ